MVLGVLAKDIIFLCLWSSVHFTLFADLIDSLMAVSNACAYVTRVCDASIFLTAECKFCTERAFFSSFWVIFHKHSRMTGLQGKGEGISLTPHTSTESVIQPNKFTLF